MSALIANYSTVAIMMGFLWDILKLVRSELPSGFAFALTTAIWAHPRLAYRHDPHHPIHAPGQFLNNLYNPRDITIGVSDSLATGTRNVSAVQFRGGT